MKFMETEIPDIRYVEYQRFGDDRGFFVEQYHQQKFAEHGIDAVFVQDNLSRSQRGVLRGLHFQIRHPQGKLVFALSGEIFDVAVDVRKTSPTFGQWVGRTLSAELRNGLYIPPGFAHGFYVLSETANVFYKCTDFYVPEHERTLMWNDEIIGIPWPLDATPQLSEKDKKGSSLHDLECFD